MAVKRLNAMGIEAKSWYQKGKASTSDTFSKPPSEENNWKLNGRKDLNYLAVAIFSTIF